MCNDCSFALISVGVKIRYNVIIFSFVVLAALTLDVYANMMPLSALQASICDELYNYLHVNAPEEAFVCTCKVLATLTM